MSEQYQPSPKINDVNKMVRTCLKCRTPFVSNGPGHRICNGCKSKTSGQRMPNQASVGSGRVVRGNVERGQ